MRVLLLGSGGREHALAWRLSSSPLLTELWCAPGNPGTAQLCPSVAVRVDDPAAVVTLARRQRIDLVVVGPEAPLVHGVADALEAAGVRVFGPGAAAARLEGSKAFAKEVMAAAGIPAARYRTFDSAGEAEAAARAQGRVVVKADGLAAGKGVVVARTPEEAAAAVRAVAAMGEAGARLVLEELLEGEEVSVIALCDGERYVLLPPAQDHKRLQDGDAGPNTGGMGAYAPAAKLLDAAALAQVGERIIGPTLREMRRRGHPFRGALYAGLMLTPEGPKVLEFNCRFGDPEAQVLVMQLGEDLLPVLDACARGQLEQRVLRLAGGVSVGVVIAAEGYPQNPRTGDEVCLPSSLPPWTQVFHAGTRLEDGRLVSAGGRVLAVCARGEDVAEARSRAYDVVAQVKLRGMHYRQDIGARGQ